MKSSFSSSLDSSRFCKSLPKLCFEIIFLIKGFRSLRRSPITIYISHVQRIQKTKKKDALFLKNEKHFIESLKFIYQFSNKIFLLFLAQFLHSYRNSDKSVSKIIIENRFLTTRRVKYLWKCVATLVKIDGLSKISRWRWVAAEVFGNSWDCLTWKTRCPRSTYLILKRLILKTFLPPPHSRATLEVYTHTRTHTRIHAYIRILERPSYLFPSLHFLFTPPFVSFVVSSNSLSYF